MTQPTSMIAFRAKNSKLAYHLISTVTLRLSPRKQVAALTAELSVRKTLRGHCRIRTYDPQLIASKAVGAGFEPATEHFRLC